ncbi:TPA: AAA family ATPase [Campylobacter jejuni]|nr:AAA family ATPase [Campylobacter jejuni]
MFQYREKYTNKILDLFKKYLEDISKDNDSKLKEDTIKTYIKDIEKISSYLKNNNLLNCNSIDDFLYCKQQIENNEKFNKINDNVKRRYIGVLNHYYNFLNNYLKKNKLNPPLNQILYGPPGTGKTYHTIDKALEILGENLESRDDKKAKFDEYVRKGQIVFATFHQSYGYEEFVEGIKPRIDSKENSKEIEYEIKDGIFKDFCDRVNKKNNIQEIQNSFWKDCESSSINFNGYKFEYYKEDGKKGLKHKDEKLIFLQTFNDLISEVGFSYSYYFTNKNNIIINKLRGTLNNEETINTYKKHYEAILDYFYEEYLPKLSNYIIIIDEINRGNVSKIFGELITLIEPSKRIGEKEELKVTLPYSGEKFGVPKNVYIIGTMNTADRSITSLDTALRRRFEFIEMMPDVSKLSMDCEGINLQELLKAINTRIEYLLDREKTIGHAFFTGVENLNDLKSIFQNKIIPLLQEYFYNDYALINAVLNDNGMIFEDKKDDKYLQKIKNLDSVNSERSIYNIASFDDKIWDKIEIYQAIYNDEIANKLKNENE